ncbi:MAG: hypothetical protein KAT58_08440 [candidate division Zixibacteria bacterium]|nr:hypothetical protein [candidate division Zixibacteria bacterium]
MASDNATDTAVAEKPTSVTAKREEPENKGGDQGAERREEVVVQFAESVVSRFRPQLILKRDAEPAVDFISRVIPLRCLPEDKLGKAQR